MIEPGDEEGENQEETEDQPQQESLNAADDMSLNEAVAIPDPKKRGTQ